MGVAAADALTVTAGPRVSIGLPVCNGEDYLRDALDSLVAQTYTDFELIISDNASTDRTREICEDYAARDRRIRYFRQPSNVGAARNFNWTFRHATGEYFKWAAHDDMCRPTFLAQCVAALDAAPDAVLCIPKTTFIDAHGHSTRDYEHPLNLQSGCRSERFLQFVGQTHIVVEIFGLVRAATLRKTPLIGSYVGSDLVLLAELGLYGAFVEVPEHLFLHREHPRRSVRTHRDLQSRSEWFDSRHAGKRMMPTWRLLMEHVGSLRRVPLSSAERASLALGVLRVANWARRQLMDELLGAMFFTNSHTR